MRYICPECGSDIPEDSEFCYKCGRKKDNIIRLDQSGHFVQPEEDKCESCGADMAKDEIFCQKFGQPRSRTLMTAFQPKLIKYGWIGLALALIPGAFGFIPGLYSIYGLGHLYFKRWSRGAVYLLFTVFFFYMKYTTTMDVWTNLLFEILSIFIYILQAMEVLVLAFMPPKSAE